MNRLALCITALACFIGMLPGMPYGYFTLLRLCVCAVSIYGAVQLFDCKAERMAWSCLALAVLFNPIIKIHLGRDIWWFVDGVAGLYFCIIGVMAKRL